MGNLSENLFSRILFSLVIVSLCETRRVVVLRLTFRVIGVIQIAIDIREHALIGEHRARAESNLLAVIKRGAILLTWRS